MYADLCASVWALSALRVAADSDLLIALVESERDAETLATLSGLDPVAIGRVMDVLASVAIVERHEDRYRLSEEGRALAARGEGLRADLAVTFGQTRALVEEARRGSLAPGWRHTDAEVIRGQAGLSFEMTTKSFSDMSKVFPELEPLFARDGARFLDVGIGGAGGAIALCKRFPNLRVVGVDPHRAAHLEARAAIAAAGLGHRIELRRERAQSLQEENTFDAAFIPVKFLDKASVVAILERVQRALVMDGCALLACAADPDDPTRRAVARLREFLWGGEWLGAAEVREIALAAGFRRVRPAGARGDLSVMLATK